jgi:catechol 2,3-dioxygenase-like lactoylglutathione lyase family enzyme
MDFRFAHLGVAVPDVDRALADYRELFGYALVCGPFDDPIQKVRVCFIARADGDGDADSQLELIVPPHRRFPPVQRLLKSGGGLTASATKYPTSTPHEPPRLRTRPQSNEARVFAVACSPFHRRG